MSSTFIPTAHQREALNRIRDWWQTDPERPFWLAGLAGTGKTETVRGIPDEFPGEVLFLAPTGKAARVLSKRLKRDVFTIHSALYVPKGGTKDKEIESVKEEIIELQGELETSKTLAQIDRLFTDLRKLEKENELLFDEQAVPKIDKADLCIVDEASMVGVQLFSDLLSHGVPLIMIGDPGQLPPVKQEPSFPKEPDFIFEEILRQKSKSKIIELAHRIRRHGRANWPDWRDEYDTDDVIIERYTSNIDIELLSFSERVICHDNLTRRRINCEMREYLGHGSDCLPKKGDKLICKDNTYMGGSLDLVNGEEAVVQSVTGRGPKGGLEVSLIYNGVPRALTISETEFRKEYGENVLDDKCVRFWYSYCTTVHGAQGSEWDRVAFISGWVPKDMRSTLPYTAVTRARDQISVYYTR